jgi:hypothetical protein
VPARTRIKHDARLIAVFDDDGSGDNVQNVAFVAPVVGFIFARL